MRQIKFKVPLVIMIALMIAAMLGSVVACASSPAPARPAATPSTTSTAASITPAPPHSPSASAAATPSLAPNPSLSPSASSSSTTSPGGNAVTINLVAKNIAFNKSTITVPAGAQVTVNFNNEDSGIPHSFSVYTNSSATTTIFKGKIITGPSTVTYRFTAPSKPGIYFFRCDVHPTIMNGQFIVK